MQLVAILTIVNLLLLRNPAPLSSQPGGEDYPLAASAAEFGDPIPGLANSEEDLHIRGRRLFRWELWRPDRSSNGFNETECSKCHLEPYFGGSNKDPKTFVSFLPDSEDRTGLKVYHRLQRNETRRFVEPTRPPDAMVRRAPALFGIGLLEAVPNVEIAKLSDPSDENKDGISGRTLVFGGAPAKFGWKPNISSIDLFVAQAFKGEMGMLVEPYEREDFAGGLGAGQVKAVSFFIKTLGPPPRTKLNPNQLEGKKLFTKVGCQTCHVGSLRTGESSIAAISKKTIEAYTDLLAHQIQPNEPLHTSIDRYDIGEYRTAPLWGLGMFGGPYWHDGSAPTILEAILKHDGEAAKSKAAFQKLAPADQKRLLEFLQAL